MATNTSVQYQAALRRQLSKEVLPIAQRYLVAHQHARKIKMEEGAGTTWTATRFNRIPLPFAPLSEGVPPIGEQLSISQVTGVAIQWGDKITLTDVAVIVTMYDLVKQARRLLAVQIAELHVWLGLELLNEMAVPVQPALKGGKAGILAMFGGPDGIHAQSCRLHHLTHAQAAKGQIGRNS